MNFRKTILAASLSACAGAAIAADKVPTLGDVLKASDISVSGYVDVSYNYLSTDQGSNTYRAYDTEHGAFNLHAVDLAISYLPASGFGGFAQLDYGQDADFNGAAGTDKTDKVDLQEGFIQYANGGFTVIGGKFATLAGAEVTEAPANTNFSRSLLYTNAIPVTHTGVRASYAPSDTLKFIVGVNNGWDILQESATANCVSTTNCADGKTAELGILASPSKMLSLAASYYKGEEYSSTSTKIGQRKLLDLVVTINATDALSFVINYDKAEQEKATATAGTAKWSGLAGYANYKINDAWRLSLRTEKFEDKNCFKLGCGFSKQEVKETTLTVGYAPAKSTELRAEIRKDESDQKAFTEGGKTTKDQNSFGLEAVYKF
jgi:hypothetical protein